MEGMERHAVSVRTRFAEAVSRPDEEIDLSEAALLIAAEEYPELDVRLYVRHLDELAHAARTRVAEATLAHDPGLLIRRFHAFLFEEMGFRGNVDDYYDPRNSFLNEVIERRTGIPISLAAVYVSLARRLGWPVHGVGFPGHFLAKWELPAGDVVVDPFHGEIVGERECRELLARVSGGQVPFRAEMLSATPNRVILARMLANLKGVWVQRNDLLRAISASDRILLLAPEAAGEYRDRGLLWLKLECYRPALADLKKYVALAPGGPDEEPIRAQVSILEDLVARIA